MEVDFGKIHVFPDLTNLKIALIQGVVLWSKTGKTIIIIKLIVTLETGCYGAYERKKAEYTEFIDLCNLAVPN